MTILDKRDAAWMRTLASTTPGVTEELELWKWTEEIESHARRRRLGIYFDVLTMPTEILKYVTTKLRERGFAVSAVLEGSVRFNTAGSTFMVKLVYVDWRPTIPRQSDADLERLADEHSGAGGEE